MKLSKENLLVIERQVNFLQQPTGNGLSLLQQKLEVFPLPEERISTVQPVFQWKYCVNFNFGGHPHQWLILFDPTDASNPPDFIFDTSTFSPNLCDLKSYVDWTPSENASLVRIFNELLHHYAEHHRRRLLATGDRLQVEYESLLSLVEQVDRVELYTTVGQSQGSQTRTGSIMARLKLSSDLLPVTLYSPCPSPYECLLLVRCHGRRLSVDLSLSDSLAALVRIQTPPFRSNDCLLDYVPPLLDRIVRHLRLAAENLDKRRALVAAFLAARGRSLLEFDAERFLSVSFLLDVLDFKLIIHASIPESYPSEPPTFTFRSIYHTNGETLEPFKQQVELPAYNSRWTVEKVVLKAEHVWTDVANQFRSNSIRSGNFDRTA